MPDCSQKWKVCQLLWLAQLLVLLLVILFISSSEGSKGKQCKHTQLLTVRIFGVSCGQCGTVTVLIVLYALH
jgi:hypothetical protein